MPYRRFEPDRPYRLQDVETGELVCTLTGAQLDDLLDLLIREHESDRDYWIDDAVLAWLTSNHADPGLVELLRAHIDRRGPAELGWAPESGAQ
ncbi:MAG TPA: hypothetical protein VK034_31400 [Enhygromyxa sp.]|nr:hypothetical protein [Enhygromyxa sp.]